MWRVPDARQYAQELIVNRPELARNIERRIPGVIASRDPVAEGDVRRPLALERRDLERDLVGVHLVVGIHPLDVVAARQAKAQRTGPIDTPLGTHHEAEFTPRFRSYLLREAIAAVGRPVVDEDDLEPRASLPDHAAQCPPPHPAS